MSQKCDCQCHQSDPSGIQSLIELLMFIHKKVIGNDTHQDKLNDTKNIRDVVVQCVSSDEHTYELIGFRYTNEDDKKMLYKFPKDDEIFEIQLQMLQTLTHTNVIQCLLSYHPHYEMLRNIIK